MEIQELIEQMGFNHHESQVYLYLLENGEQPASKVAGSLAIPRSTTRGVLDKLCERDVVSKLYKRNTQYYSCKPPAALVKFLHTKLERTQSQLGAMQGMLPLLEAMHEKPHVVPKVRFFEGPEGVVEAFNHSLYQGIDEVLIFTSYKFLRTPIIQKNDDELYMPLRIKKGIGARVLVGKTSESRKMVSKVPGELRERRFIPDKYVLPGNIHIYGNCVTYFSAGEGEHMAVIIESSMIVATMVALFEFMWEKCQ